MWTLLGVALATFLSCSGSAEDPEAQRLALVADAAGLCDEWAKAACNETVIRRCAARDAAACEATQRRYCERLVPAESYDPADAWACVEAVRSAYQDGELTRTERGVVAELASPCAALFEGDKKEGQSCARSSECDGNEGLSCVTRAGHALGTCQFAELIDGGYECQREYQECAHGFYCDGTHCLARGSSGDACSEETPCAKALNCVEQDARRVCRPKLASGESCSAEDECASGLCVRTPGAERGWCAATLVLSPIEAQCDHLR
jgi:hypothetical protein